MKNENISSDKNKYWFPAKKYGWGWSFPNTWQGGVVFLVWLACDLAAAVLLGANHLHLFIASTIVLGIALLIIVFIKGEPPRWRWGEKSGTDKSGRQSD